MILKALYDYYYRSKDLPPIGLEYKDFYFLLVINKEGKFIRLEDSRIDADSAKSYLVLQTVERTSTPIANVCWDNFSYVLNLSEEVSKADTEPALKKAKEKNLKKYDTFVARIKELQSKLPDNESLKALSLFYAHSNEEIISNLSQDPLWDDFCKNITRNISFRLEGSDTIIAEDPAIIDVVLKETDGKGVKERCLVTGIVETIAITQRAIAGLGGQQKPKLVSFQKSSGYDSYGKEQGYNAPISKEAAFTITTALNRLLEKGSKNKFSLGSRKYVFWATGDTEVSREAENCFYSFFNLNQEEDPDQGTQKVEKVFKSIFSGERPTDANDKFYILGLTQNVARIAVVYWKEISIRDFARNLLQHFDDMEIIDNRQNKTNYKGVYQMAASASLKGKVDDLSPNILESTIKSVFEGTAYPYTLYMACLRRVRAEQQLTLGRAAVIKAYLNRQSNNHNKLTAMLDVNNKNAGYVCGRLFATLEYLQKTSSGIDSIRQRYMNAASSTPAAVFGNLMNLSIHHEDKLDKEGQVVFFKKIKNDILDLLSAEGFPAHLDIQDQGRFFVGYHHQMSEFYRKKEEK